MELFTLHVEKNTVYYKGCKKKLSIDDWIKPMWVGDHITAQKYGHIVYQFETNKKLNMINIYSGLFHSHLIDQLNLKYTHFDSISGIFNVDPHVKLILSAIGLPDSQSVINIHGTPKCRYTPPFSLNNIIDNVAYFHNKERNSIKSVDLQLANELYSIYGQHGFDGYIAPFATPTRFECGWFNQECCLFNPSQCINIVQQSGGSFLSNNNDKKEEIARLVKINTR